MSNIRQTKCSICGRPIKTTVGAVGLNRAPVVCRQCFGTESYSGPVRGSVVTMTPEPPPAEH